MGPLSLGLVHHPAVGETRCGDMYAIVEREGFYVVAVADGLGHGAEAELAAKRAIETVQQQAELSPAQLLEACHEALRGTRGAVLGIARIEPDARTLRYAGLGNIEARIVTEAKTFRPVSVNGIVGHSARKFREESFAFGPGDVLVLHTDGISDRFEVSARARERDLQMLAAQIAREFGRTHDDQLLLMLREAP